MGGRLNIAVTHMSHDENKGDLAILSGLVAALDAAQPTATIQIVSAELAERGIGQDRRIASTRALGKPVRGTPTPSLSEHHGSRAS